MLGKGLSGSFGNRIFERNQVSSLLTFVFSYKASLLETFTEYSQDPCKDMSVPMFLKQHYMLLYLGKNNLVVIIKNIENVLDFSVQESLKVKHLLRVRRQKPYVHRSQVWRAPAIGNGMPVETHVDFPWSFQKNIALLVFSRDGVIPVFRCLDCFWNLLGEPKETHECSTGKWKAC